MDNIKDEQLKKILSELAENLIHVYGKRLKEVILYGSVARGVPSKESDIDIIVLVNNLGGANMSDINALLEKAINETAKLNDGEDFLLRDLFKGYEWNRISRSNRLLLGTLFLNKINSENLDISASAKTSSGQQKYQIVRRK